MSFNFFELFMLLYFCNLVLDFPLQSDFIAMNKSKNWYILLVHSCIWGLGLSGALLFLGMLVPWKVAFLVLGHYLIDALKCKGYMTRWGLTDQQALLLDQSLHIMQIFLVIP